MEERDRSYNTKGDTVDASDACGYLVSHEYEQVENTFTREEERDLDAMELEEECLTENVAYQVATNAWKSQVEVGE